MIHIDKCEISFIYQDQDPAINANPRFHSNFQSTKRRWGEWIPGKASYSGNFLQFKNCSWSHDSITVLWNKCLFILNPSSVIFRSNDRHHRFGSTNCIIYRFNGCNFQLYNEQQVMLGSKANFDQSEGRKVTNKKHEHDGDQVQCELDMDQCSLTIYL